MKKNIFLFVVSLLLGCSTNDSQNVGFDILIKSIQEQENVYFLHEAIKAEPFYRISPIELLQTKDTVYTVNHYQNIQSDLSNFFPSRLNESNQVLLKTVKSFLRHKIYLLKMTKESEFSSYSMISILKKNVLDDKQTDDEQFVKIIQGLEKIPKYFSEAKSVIKTPDKKQLQLAIDAYSKDYFFLKNDLPILIRKPDILKNDQIDFSRKNQKAQIVIKDFIAFLNSHLFELGNSF